MNIESKYIEESNNYIITDQNVKMKTRENHPNIQAILIEENIIEKTTKDLNSIKREKDEYLEVLQDIIKQQEENKKTHKRLQKKMLIININMILATIFLSKVIFGNAISLATIFGPKPENFTKLVFGCITMGSIFEICYYILERLPQKSERICLTEKYQSVEEKIKELEKEIQVLSLVLEQSEKKLEELVKDAEEKNVTSEISVKITPVNYRELLEIRRHELQNMYQKSLVRKPNDREIIYK